MMVRETNNKKGTRTRNGVFLYENRKIEKMSCEGFVSKNRNCSFDLPTKVYILKEEKVEQSPQTFKNNMKL